MIYGVYRILSLLPLPISIGYVYSLIMAFIAIYVGYVIYRMGRGLRANIFAVELGRLAGSLNARTLLTISMGVILLMSLNTMKPTQSPPIAEATKAPFKLVTTLEKSSFALGENVTITIKLVNVGEDPLKVTFLNRSPPTWLRLKVYWLGLKVYESSLAAWGALTDVTLYPGNHIAQIHKWTPKSTGTYQIIGFVNSIGYINDTFTPSFTLETPPIEITIT